MGTWGHKAFENDDAADWLGDLSETTGWWMPQRAKWKKVEAALRIVLDNNDYLDAPEGATAIAAAALVAGEPVDTEVYPGATTMGSPPSNLRPLASKALDRILGDQSELHELWAEGGELEDWKTDVQSIKDRLK